MSNYRVLSTASGGADGTTWADAYTSTSTALSGKTSSDVLWLGPSHAHVANAAITWSAPTSYGLRILGVDSDSTEPAAALNGSTAAYDSVGAANAAFLTTGMLYANRVALLSGTNNSGACVIRLGYSTAQQAQYYEHCSFVLQTISTSAFIQFGNNANSSNSDSLINLNQCTLKFGATAQYIVTGQTRLLIDGLSLDGTGSAPTTLFKPTSGVGAASMLCRDSDLTGVTWSNLMDISYTDPYDATFLSCKFPSGFAFSTGTHAGRGGLVLRCHQCASGDSQIGFYELTGAGTVVEDTGIYVSGDDMTMKMTPSSSASFPGYPLIARQRIPIAAADTGSAQSITVKMVTDRATALDNDEVAVRVHYLGTGSTSLASVATSEAADVFATPATLTTNSDSWTGSSGFTNEQKRQVTVNFTPQEAGDCEIEVCVFAALTNPLYVAMPVALD